MLWLWSLFGLLALGAGGRYLARLHAARSARAPRVDDEALRRILETGTLPGDDEEPLDLDAAARAEEEFWSESWDDPEEYHP